MSLATLKDKVARLIEKAQSGGTDEIEAIIDNSGVLDSTEGTVEEKVEQLLLYSKLLKCDNALSMGIRFDLETIDYYLDFPYMVNFQDLLRDNKHIKKIKGVNTTRANNVVRMLLNSTIEEIELPFDLSGVTSPSGVAGSFQTTSLREVRFVQSTIKFSIVFTSDVLTAESKQSIFDGLATVETAQTLTLAANLKILQSQVNSANAKGWTVAGGTIVSEEEYYG